MRRIVLIDGENFAHALRRHLANKPDSFAERHEILGLNYRTLIENVLGGEGELEIRYYGAKIRNSGGLSEKSLDAVVRHQAKLVNQLIRQKIEVKKVGILRFRLSEPCPSCGNIQEIASEKGVDVGLAIDMCDLAAPGVELTVISSDTDILPAIRLAKSKGSKVVFMGNDFMPMLSLIKICDSFRTITKDDVINSKEVLNV
jgi:uncharacterized LabA/DUF88 family protein